MILAFLVRPSVQGTAFGLVNRTPGAAPWWSDGPIHYVGADSDELRTCAGTIDVEGNDQWAFGDAAESIERARVLPCR